MFTKRRFILLATLAALVLATFASAAAAPRATPPTGAGAVVAWNTIAQRAAIQVAKHPQTQSMIEIAFVQAAVYNAVVAIAGGYQPYKLSLAPRPGASVDAAVAAAAHGVLASYFPAQQAALDADYATALAAIPAGAAKSAGIALGQESAAAIVALRQGDGFEASTGFTVPVPAPGAWQPPADQAPQTPWVATLRPLMLQSPDQFRPGPAPDLGSGEWVAQYNEVKALGRIDSPDRTAEQTDIARFWATNAVAQYNFAFQEIAQGRQLGTLQAARLFAMGNLVGGDALIACFDAKYHELFWRPQFAIPLGGSDGNPDTIGDPSWKPLLATPNHPEYPAAHGCLTSAEAEVLAEFLGTNRLELDLTSTTPNLAQPRRHYSRVVDLVHEMIDARVWGGVHYRGSVVKGVDLGRKVAHWALARYFLLQR